MFFRSRFASVLAILLLLVGAIVFYLSARTAPPPIPPSNQPQNISHLANINEPKPIAGLSVPFGVGEAQIGDENENASTGENPDSDSNEVSVLLRRRSHNRYT